MLNYKVSFVTCDFTKKQLQEWLRWVRTNIPCEVTEPTIEEVSDASYAKASDSTPEWFDK
jgi:hypothetical protein